MAQSGYTPISLYYSTTASALPTAGNLVAGELALNTLDEKLYFKNSSGTVKLLASVTATTNVSSITFGSTGLTPNTATTGAVTVAGTLAVANGGTGITSFGTGVAGALGQNVSGTGSIALTTSAVLTTPNLGTPSAGTLTSCTGLPLTTGITGTLAIGNGGTGQTTASTAFNALSPLTTLGDTLYGGASGAGTRLGIGSTSQVLTVVGGVPAWATPASGGVTTITFGSTGLTPSSATSGAVTVAGTLAVANGGTGATTNAGTAYALKGANSDITSITGLTTALTVAQGGTGSTTITTNSVMLGNGTSALSSNLVAPSTTGNILTSNGTTWTSAAPAGGGLGGITAYNFAGTASKATTVLTVTIVTDGAIKVGDTIRTITTYATPGVSLGVVSSFGTGTGGIGTYNMSTSSTQTSIKVFTSAGTFTIPTGKTVVKVTVLGGGGGGGGAFAGGGGGGSGAAIKYLTGLTPGNTLIVTRGAYGVGSAYNGAGTAGGTSSVASGTQSITTISATGGSGGSNNYVPGVGGAGTNGDLNCGGSSGSYGFLATYSCTTYYYGGRGGSSFMGGSGSGDYILGGPAIVGTNYGGGGGGGADLYNVGADGGNGVVFFEY